MTRLSLVLGLCALQGFAQVRAAKPRKPRPSKSASTEVIANSNVKWPVLSIRIEGNRNYSEDDIVAVTGLRVGQNAAKEDFDAARDRLLATGAFETVGYRFDPVKDAKGNAASFQVVEIQQVFPFRFEGLHVDTNALTAHLRSSLPLFSEKLPATREMLNRVTAAASEWLAKTGNTQEVIAKLTAVEAGKMEIVIRPFSMPTVAEMHFLGNAVIRQPALREAVAGPAIGAVFTEARLREILDNSARPLYEALGRLKVEWEKIEAVPAKDVKGLAVTVHVNEGPEYKLRKVELAKVDIEDRPAVNDVALMKEAGFELNEVANLTKVRAGVERMERSLRRNGYLEVESKIARTLDDQAKAVDVIVQLDPGPQFTFATLTIQGLDIETEPHIRKMWALKKGQPFNFEYPDYFLNKIREDGIFDNLGRTRSKIEPNPGNGTVDVTLSFEGEKAPAPPKRP